MEDEVKVQVYIQAISNATVEVELTNEQLQELADNLDTPVENLSDADIIDYASEQDFTRPSLCWQCSNGLDLGEFEVVDGVGTDIGRVIER